MRRFKPYLAPCCYALFVCLLITLCTLAYWSVVPASHRASDTVFYIKKGSTITDIAASLKTHGLIHSQRFFIGIARLAYPNTAFRSGYFHIQKNDGQRGIIQALTEQNGNHTLIKLTIPEDFSIQQIAARLEKKGICNKEAFEKAAYTTAKSQFKDRYPFLQATDHASLEGYLFPDTYFFKQNEPIAVIIGKFLSEFNTHIYLPFRQGPDYPRFTFHQWLTLASMIQKESRHTAEMPTIASVFHNRLKKRMRLASDPTVVYALGKSYKNKVYYKDLKIDSPYNTYKYSGFPPTPISCVGQQAFEAALNPKQTPYYFFVALPDSRHYFSRTYEEHLRIQRQQKR